MTQSFFRDHPASAHRGLRSGLALRAILALAAAVVLVISGILLAREATVDHVFPPYVAGDTQTVIASYSGPLLALAIGIGMLGGLALVSAVTDLWRRRLVGPYLVPASAGQASVLSQDRLEQ